MEPESVLSSKFAGGELDGAEAIRGFDVQMSKGFDPIWVSSAHTMFNLLDIF